jgi:hypothetical protein
MLQYFDRVFAFAERSLPILPTVLWGGRWCRGDRPAARVHRAYRSILKRRLATRARLDAVIYFAIWPLSFVCTIVALTAVNYRVFARRHGAGLWRQVSDQCRLALCHGVPSPWYYIYELHNEARRAPAEDYLHRHELKLYVYHALRDYTASGPDKSLTNKLEFLTACDRRGLPAIAIICVVADGAFDWREPDRTALPASDLFVKPLKGKGGRHARAWRWHAGLYHSNGQEVDEPGLRALLARQSRSRGLLVQPGLANHADIQALSAGALATCRVLTCLDETGAPEVVGAVIRMATEPGRPVDNIHAGGIAAPIDLDTGRLGPASDHGLFALRGWLDEHPATSAPITDRLLPFWAEIHNLALRAHEAFTAFIIVGWDIAVTETGPVLVEGNSGPDVDLMQRPMRGPLGSGRCGELLAFHVERALAGKPPPHM